MRCTLCIRTVSKNGGPCETYGKSTANNGPTCKVVVLNPLPRIPHRICKVQFKTFQLFHIWNVLWNLSQLCTHDFHFTAPGILLMLQVHKGCHASDSDFVHPLFRLGKGSSRLETKHCPQQCSAWYATLLVCCTAVSSGEMFSRVLPFCANRTFLASLTFLHWLVRSYTRTTNLSSTGIASRIFCIMRAFC